MENTQKALKFIQNNKSEFSEQTQQNIDEILNGLNENPEFFKDNKEGVEQLVNILNELYSYNCKYQNQELQQQIYNNNGYDMGLLWNRDYTKDDFEAIPGINFVCGHDANVEQTLRSNKDKTIFDIDIYRSCGYTPALRRAGYPNIRNRVGLCVVNQTGEANIDVEQLPDCVTIQYRNDLQEIDAIEEVELELIKLNEDIEFSTTDFITEVMKRQKALEEQRRLREEDEYISDVSSDFDEITPKRILGNGLIKRSERIDFNAAFE
ncbi:MAG: hypothetical protein J6C50_02095, partial [Rickettsiales bacterium]|nr:hypothetical protein [Rickettsiales bacterium]